MRTTTLLCTLVAAGAVTLAPRGGSATPLALAFQHPAKDAIPWLTGLPLDSRLQIERVDRDRALELLAAELHEELGRPEAKDYQRLLTDFGFLPPGVDLEQQYLETARLLVAGFYQASSKRLYIVEGWDASSVMGVLQEPISVAHELVHAAQDQNMDLNGLRAAMGSDEDQTSALSFALEGQATVIGYRIGIPLTFPPMLPWTEPIILASVSPAYGDINLAASRAMTQELPPYIVDQMADKYVTGAELAWRVERAWGRDGHTWLACHPPRSTEHVLHPDKYLHGEDPPVSVEVPGATVRLSMGEWSLRWLLRQHLERDRATQAAAGWGGDSVALLPDGTRLWRLVMDTVLDAEELESALREALVSARVAATVVRADREVQAWLPAAQPPSPADVEELHRAPLGRLPPLPPPPEHSVCRQEGKNP